MNTDIIYSPVITEKSSELASKNVYVFKVAKNANKIQIKRAIEELFKVRVKSVNTLNTKSKSKRVGRYTGKTKTFKKAYVTLENGQAIEI